MFSISALIEMVKSGIGYFTKKKEREIDMDNNRSHDTNETNREEIKQGSGWRSFLGYVLGTIILYSYIIVPVLDYFGIVVFQMPMGDIFKLLLLMLTGI